MTRKSRPDAGVSLVEVIIALSIMVLTLIGLLAGISYASRTNASIHEDEMAMRGAQKMIETMRSYPVNMIWACFNNNPNDAATLPTAYGWSATSYPESASNKFAVEGLQPVNDVVNGVTWNTCGMISFPGNNGAGTSTLVELTDTTDPLYDANGTDLDADNTTGETICTSATHGAHNLLPVTITIRWRAIGGTRTMTFRYLLISNPTGGGGDFKYPGQP